LPGIELFAIGPAGREFGCKMRSNQEKARIDASVLRGTKPVRRLADTVPFIAPGVTVERWMVEIMLYSPRGLAV